MQQYKFGWAALASVCSAVVVSVSALSTSPGREAHESRTSIGAEVIRLEHHFKVVERELLSRDVSSLSSSQRAARLRAIERLRQYREAAVFPHNHEDAGRRVPYFRDEHGTLCAMAYLIASSGGADVVNHIAQTNNQVYMRELAHDRDVTSWLALNGLSLEEAARIQPTYGEARRDGNVGYQVASILMGASEGGLIVWNLMADSRSLSPGVTAMLGGALGFTLGVSGVGDSRISETLLTVNVAMGAATMLVGVVHTIGVLWNRGADVQKTPTPGNSHQWSPLFQSDVAGRTQIGIQRRF